ncbi:ABC transporter permease [Candidatus Saccharibacteria bacterium TM7i]|nr:ABC transporter permease [Candidatus Saccharibacteria bacterium TM7i]
MISTITSRYRYSLILLRELVVTEFKLRYQGSVLGYLWSLLKPLFTFIILYFVFVHFLKIGGDVPGWPVAMLLGIVLWNFFSEITNNGVGAIVGRGDLIRKLNFPKYIIVIASSISALINLVFNLAVLVVFLFVANIDIGWTALLTPLYMIEIFIFGLGIAFILSTLYVRFRDINYIWEIIMQALFYGSAIIYPLSIIATPNPMLAQIILLNPVTQSIQSARAALVDPANATAVSLGSPWWVIVTPFILTIVVFIFGAWLFKRNSPHFAENV